MRDPTRREKLKHVEARSQCSRSTPLRTTSSTVRDGSGNFSLAAADRYGGPVSEQQHNTEDHESERVVGVGPWDGPWPTEPHYDPDLLREGDRRNVADRYRYWRLDAIVADLDTTRSGLHIAVENTGHDFNLGSVVRTANAFNVSGVHIVGRRRWNRRGAMVTDRYLHIHYHENAAAFIAYLQDNDLPLIGIDNLPGSHALADATLPNPAVLLYGEEGPGISPDLWDACSERVYIPQVGSTRSINLGAAAAITMFEWSRRHHLAYGGVAESP